MLLANVGLTRDTASKDLFVSSATIERGEGTGSGAHSTAFVVFQDAAINAVLGKTFKDAVNDLIALSEKVTGLPNYITATDKTDTDSKLADIKKDTNYSNPDGVEDFEKVTVLQNLMREYCLLRNSVPGSYFPKISGSKTKGMKSEKAGGNKLSEENEQYRLDDNYKRNLNNTKQGLWETFDQQILPVQDSKERAGDYYPKLVAVISNHLQTCLDSYPYIQEDDFVKGCQFLVEKCLLELNSKHKKTYGPRVVDKLVKMVEKEVF
ncbi:hypothetical protein CBW65_03740 [Tumebacillus avium]|uniref:Uncharacterized protein n=1 Tax=Tumebacillus avium TaxID=1903704 RepID=A0A1Y0ILI9_9BACL|nr:hypothetical protein CBW65_03740 [Tumebacillus avium]